MPAVPSVRDIDVETIAAIAGILARMTLGLAEASASGTQPIVAKLTVYSQQLPPSISRGCIPSSCTWGQ